MTWNGPPVCLHCGAYIWPAATPAQRHRCHDAVGLAANPPTFTRTDTPAHELDPTLLSPGFVEGEHETEAG